MLLTGAELGTAQPRKNILLLLLLSYSEKSPKANCSHFVGSTEFRTELWNRSEIFISTPVCNYAI